MDFLTPATLIHPSGETTTYYTGGSPNGIPLIFIHGWPDLAHTWHHQLHHFTTTPSLSSTYRVYAPDMRGYGASSSPSTPSSYALEALVADLVDFAAQLEIKSAVWIGHDWGAAIVSALAAHHPSLVLGLALLSVPYRTLELGLPHLLTLVNRSIYPAHTHPYAQWAYMAAYQSDPAAALAAYAAADLEKWLRARYARHNPALHGAQARTSATLRDGWAFASLPDVPLSATSLSPPLYAALRASLTRHGFAPPTAYYRNHAANAAYAATEVDAGVLRVPVLFIDARHDAVCSVSTTPLMGAGQRAAVKDLTVVEVEAGHWVMLEAPGKVNEALEGWLGERVARGAE